MAYQIENQNYLNTNTEKELNNNLVDTDINRIKKILSLIYVKFIIIKLIMKMVFYAKFHILVELLI